MNIKFKEMKLSKVNLVEFIDHENEEIEECQEKEGFLKRLYSVMLSLFDKNRRRYCAIKP